MNSDKATLQKLDTLISVSKSMERFLEQIAGSSESPRSETSKSKPVKGNFGILEAIGDSVKKSTDGISKEQMDAAKFLVKLATTDISAAIKTMALVSPLVPIAILSVKGFELILTGLSNSLLSLNTKVPKETSEKLLELTKTLMMIVGTFLHGFFLMAKTAPQLIRGYLTFNFLLFGLIGTFTALNVLFSIKAGGLSNFVKSSLGLSIDSAIVGNILLLTKTISLFALSLVLIGATKSYIEQGFLTFVSVLTRVLVSLILAQTVLKIGNRLSGGFTPDSGPLKSMFVLASSMAMFTLTFILMGLAGGPIKKGVKVFEETLLGVIAILTFMSSVVKVGERALASWITKKDGFVDNGGPIGGLLNLAKGIALFTLTLILISYTEPYITKGLKTFTKIMFELVIAFGALAILDRISKGGTKGIATSLLLLSGSILVITGALWMYVSKVQDKLTWEGIRMLGAVIVGLGTAAAVLGFLNAGGQVKSGAIVIAILSGTLLAFSAALLVYSKAASGLTWENLGMLGAVIVGIGTAASVVGVLNTATAGSVMVGALILGALSGTLLVFAYSLLKFKESKFTLADGEILRNALTSVILGFLGWESMENWHPVATGTAYALLTIGIPALLLASVAFGEISKGISRFKDTGWDPKADPEKVRSLVSSIVTVFSDVGSGKLGDISFWSVTKGVLMIAGVSKAISDLAKGVQAFANLSFTEYEVVNGKLVVKSVTKLSESDIQNAAKNIGFVITTLAKPLADFGNTMAGNKGTSGFFVSLGLSKSSLQLGLEALGTLGKAVVDMAKGVQAFASMQFFPMTVQKDPKTGLNVLVPGNPEKLKKSDIDNAITNISLLMTTLTKPLAEFGKMMEGGETWFGLGKNNITAGIEAFSKMSSALGTMVETVIKFADGQYVIHGVENGKLVPKSMGNWKDKQEKAMTEIKKFLVDFGQIFSDVSSNSTISEDTVKYYDSLGIISKKAQEMMSNLKEGFSDSKSSESIAKNFGTFVGTIEKEILKIKETQKIGTFVMGFSKMAETIEKLSKVVSPFEKFTKTFGELSKHMKTFSENFMLMKPDGIRAFETWTKAIENLAKVELKNSGKIVDFIDKTTSSAFGLGTKVDSKVPSEFNVAEKQTAIQNTVGPKPQTSGTTTVQTQSPQIDTQTLASAIATAISTALKNLNVETIKVDKIVNI